MGPETSEGCSTASGTKNAESRYQRTNLTFSFPLPRLVAAGIHRKQWSHLLDRYAPMLPPLYRSVISLSQVIYLNLTHTRLRSGSGT